MTRKMLVLAEGPTEEAFIKQVLSPALPGVWLVPTVVKTRITGAKPEQGGQVTYHEFKRQLNLLLRDSSAVGVTTMLDYQGLGHDFPGRAQPEGGQCAGAGVVRRSGNVRRSKRHALLPFHHATRVRSAALCEARNHCHRSPAASSYKAIAGHP